MRLPESGRSKRSETGVSLEWPTYQTRNCFHNRKLTELGFFSLEHQYRELHRVVAPAQMTLALE